MEAAAREPQRDQQQRDRQQRDRRQQQREAAENGGRALSLSGQSYWLDLWLFILFDLALFVVIYLLP